MPREEKIADIIQKRRPLLERLERVEKNLQNLDDKLKKLINSRNGFSIDLAFDFNDSNIYAELERLNLTDISKSIYRMQKELRKLKARFSRSTLNIGVVGRARQGKSRLLQSLSGLTSAEIPDGDLGHCTGVRSTIYHSPNQQEASGKVYFHSEQSFLREIISPYYQKLRLGDLPANLDRFGLDTMPQLPTDLSGNAEHKAMYEHLIKYRNHLEKYRHWLARSSPLKISRNEIREYVAQDNANGDRVYFNYLAVKDVSITCSFPNEDVGQIALVDMPGLGDTGVGDEERMVNTLGQNVDAVLFVRMPSSSGDYWADVDVKLYDTAKSALVELPIKLWSFMVLNHRKSYDGDNYRNCLDLQNSIASKHIDVTNCAIANCADPEEANQMLDLVLDYLADRIADLDRQYALACQERLDRLQNEIGTCLHKARHIFTKFRSNSHLSPTLFNPLLEDLSIGLVELLGSLRDRKENINPYLEEQVNIALENCEQDKGIPSEEAIYRRASTPNLGGSQKATYLRCVAELRSHLSRQFLALDDGLKQFIDSIKAEVTEVLISSGRLGNLSEKRNSEFLRDLAELLADHQHHQLELGFRTLWKFELSYSGLLLADIREPLNELLTPDTNDPPDLPLDAATVRSDLEHFYGLAIGRCREILNEWLSKPSRTGYYMVEEFVDRVLYAKGMEHEWFSFLSWQDIRCQVWSEFKTIEKCQQFLQDWNAQVEEALAANQPDGLRFSN